MFDVMRWTYHGTVPPMTDVEKMVKSLFGKGPQDRDIQTGIRNTGSNYTLEAEIPGFRENDISIDISGNWLTISAHHPKERFEKDQKDGYLRKERYDGTYSRSFNVSEIRTDKISGSYESGILKLKLPKKGSHMPKPCSRTAQ